MDDQRKRQWQEDAKEKVSALAYQVMFEDGTERAFTHPYDKQFEEGTYHCACCDALLFDSQQKFNSGTGWPSFFDAQADMLETQGDERLAVARTEYHCKQCGAHQGHVFEDGPLPTGLRYCNNGVALSFKKRS